MSKNALVVDDSQLARTMIRSYLANLREDWSIVLAQDAEVALERCDQTAPDIMFIDFNMPGLNGIQLIEKLRENQLYAPAAIVTANVQDSVRQKAEDLNVGFIPKPITKEKIEGFLKLVAM